MSQPPLDMLPPGPEETDIYEGYDGEYEKTKGYLPNEGDACDVQYSDHSYHSRPPPAPYQVFVVNPDGTHTVLPGTQPAQTNNVEAPYQEGASMESEGASLSSAYILAIGLGIFGAHHFYLRRPKFGVLYLCTLGLCGFGYVIDWFRLPFLVRDYNNRLYRMENEPYPADRTLSDAYVLWFPLGLFGVHHYYLRQWTWAIPYTFSLGLFGIGWIMDAFRMSSMVKDCNSKLEVSRTTQTVEGYRSVNVTSAYLMAIPVHGLFGAHHYYMGRLSWGLLYTFSLGLLGVGWIADLFRMSVLVDRCNSDRITQYENNSITKKKYLDDAYVLHFPLGLFGAHHFYLGRIKWGILYACTIGCAGVGWIVDIFRMPSLVKEANEDILNKTDRGGAVAYQNNTGPVGEGQIASVVVYPGPREPVYNPSASAAWEQHHVQHEPVYPQQVESNGMQC